MVRLSGECRSITAPENLSRKTPLHLKLSAPEYEGLWPLVKDQLNSVPDEYCYQNLRIREYNRILSEMAHQHPLCQILLSIPGIGPINATAIYSAICNGAQFNSGYQLFYSPGVTCNSSAANR
jgi:transposase